MRAIFITVVFFSAVFIGFANAGEPYKNIVAASGTSHAEVEVYTIRLKRSLEKDETFSRLRETEGFKVHTRASGRYFITTIEPFYNEKSLFYVLEKVYDHFPDAFVFTHIEGEAIETEEVEAVEAAAVSSIVPESQTPQVTAPEPAQPVVTPGRADPVPAAAATEDIVHDRWLLYIVLFLAIIGVLVSFRTIQQQRKLTNIKKKLDEEHRNLEAMMAHQEDMMVNVGQKMQAPAREIIKSSEKILQTKLNTVQTQELRNIRNSDELLLEITNDLIDFMQLKSDKITLRHEVFNLNNVLDELAGTISARERGRKIEFIFDIEKGVPAKLIGDSLRLGQVLGNLLENAMKCTEAGEVRLHIKRLDSSDDKVPLCFEIADTGRGIAPQLREEIFEPFSPAHSDQESGLGLYLAKALTQRMQGTVVLDDSEEQGSVFVVTIPFDAPDPNEKRHYRLPSKAYTAHRIVIVEIQPTAAEALKKMLEYFKNDVTVCTVESVCADGDILFDTEVIVVAENAFTPEVISVMKRVQKQTDAKIVLAGSMIDAPHGIDALEPLIDARIMKPLNLQRVYDLIVDLFEPQITEEKESGSTPRHTSPTALKHTPQEAMTEVPETPNVSKASFARFAGASLLLVEDNMINQKVMLGLLKESGIDVTVANDGLEGLEAVENSEKPFNLVLMDINMPVMDGYEATKNIRSKPEFDALPIVSLTGLGLPEEVAKMYAIGMNAHLTKPINIGRLYTIFDSYLPTAAKPGSFDIEAISRFKNTAALSAAEGLARASGDEELYVQILEEFVQLFASSDDEIKDYIVKDDQQSLRQLCLDIKGVAANVGADMLAGIAGEIHKNVSEGDEKQLNALGDRYGEALQEVLGEIRRYIP